MGHAATPLNDEPPGANEALRAAYEEHFEYVWHTVRRLGARDRDIEDLAHDVFVTFHKTIDRYDRSRPLKPWLYGIAFRVVSDYRRKASFSREVSPGEHPTADPGPLPIHEVQARRRRQLVADALEDLPMDQRAVFVMVEIEERSVVEVAEALGLNTNTAYSRLRLGRRKFAEAVRRLVGDADSRRGGS